MPRDSVIGTGWQDAWGTAGTQAMKPSPFIEGLGSWAGKIDDRLTFLALQQADTVFSTDLNMQYHPAHNAFKLLEQWRCYYSGYHPQMLVGFDVYKGGSPLAVTATLSVSFDSVDFGTVIVGLSAATIGVEWYADIPDTFDAGEYTFKLYAASGDDQWFNIDIAGPFMAFLPTRF